MIPSAKPIIYVLEDNADIGFILELFLSEEGYQVFLYPSIAQISAAISTALPQLFLLDVMLPDGDGLDLCKRLKQQEHSARIPAIMMSANFYPGASKLGSPADDFIPKPFDLLGMAAKIETLLSAQRPQGILN